MILYDVLSCSTCFWYCISYPLRIFLFLVFYHLLYQALTVSDFVSLYHLCKVLSPFLFLSHSLSQASKGSATVTDNSLYLARHSFHCQKKNNWRYCFKYYILIMWYLIYVIFREKLLSKCGWSELACGVWTSFFCFFSSFF